VTAVLAEDRNLRETLENGLTATTAKAKKAKKAKAKRLTKAQKAQLAEYLGKRLRR
jgi:hypothetical protein